MFAIQYSRLDDVQNPTSTQPPVNVDVSVAGVESPRLTISDATPVIVKTTPPSGNLTSRTVVSANSIYKQCGVCVHVNFGTAVWKYRDYWSTLIRDFGCYYVRSSIDDNSMGIEALENARAHGYKYIMLPLPEDTIDTSDMSTATQNALIAKINWVASNYADVVIGFEGLNEPNQSRSGGVLPSNWPEMTVFWQKKIYNAVRSHPELDGAEVIGPSLHDTALDQSNGDHLLYLKYGTQSVTAVAGKEGIGPYVERWGMHSYSKGNIPETALDTRVSYFTDAFGSNVKILASETGYHNTINISSGGFIPVRQETAGVYVPRGMLEFARRGLFWTRFELLDDPDPGTKDQVQANFGMVMVDEGQSLQAGETIAEYNTRIINRVPTATNNFWTVKPEYTTGKALLAKLKDMGSGASFDTDYQPANVGMEIAAVNPSASDKLDWMLVGYRDGTVRLFMWRDIKIQNTTSPYAMITTGVGPIDVKVTDAAGIRTVAVGPELVDIMIRRS